MAIDFTQLTPDETREMFIEWVGTQPPDSTYNYHSMSLCAVGKFLTDKGVPFHTADAGPVWTATHVSNSMRGRRVIEAISTHPWTMGELAKRLEAV